MKTKRNISFISAILSVLLLSLSVCASAQDESATEPTDINIGIPVYSQYLHNGLIVNPAYAGTRGALSGFLSYRKQWFGIEGSPMTESISLHTPMKDEKVAVGLMAQFMQFGFTRSSNLYGSYAYHIKLEKGRLSFGLKAGFDMSNTNYGKLSYTDLSTAPPDPVFTSEDKPYILPNAGVGVYYYNDDFFAGLTIPSFLGYQKSPSGKVSPNLSFGNNNFIITAGGLLSVSDLLKIKPSMLINFSLNETEKISQFDINTNFIIADLVWLGAAYRISEQVLVGIAQLQVNSQLMIGLSYDYPVGRMQSYSNGSCEFVIRYDFGSKVSVSNPRYF